MIGWKEKPAHVTGAASSDDNRVVAKRRGAIARERRMPLAFEKRGMGYGWIYSRPPEIVAGRDDPLARWLMRVILSLNVIPLPRVTRAPSPADKCRWHAIDPRCLQNNALSRPSSKSAVARERVHCPRIKRELRGVRCFPSFNTLVGRKPELIFWYRNCRHE